MAYDGGAGALGNAIAGAIQMLTGQAEEKRRVQQAKQRVALGEDPAAAFTPDVLASMQQANRAPLGYAIGKIGDIFTGGEPAAAPTPLRTPGVVLGETMRRAKGAPSVAALAFDPETTPEQLSALVKNREFLGDVIEQEQAPGRAAALKAAIERGVPLEAAYLEAYGPALDQKQIAKQILARESPAAAAAKIKAQEEAREPFRERARGHQTSLAEKRIAASERMIGARGKQSRQLERIRTRNRKELDRWRASREANREDPASRDRLASQLLQERGQVAQQVRDARRTLGDMTTLQRKDSSLNQELTELQEKLQRIDKDLSEVQGPSRKAAKETASGAPAPSAGFNPADYVPAIEKATGARKRVRRDSPLLKSGAYEIIGE